MPAGGFANVQVDVSPPGVETPGLPGFVGQSVAARALSSIVSTVARRRSTVLLLGDTGTGKELLARCIHARSTRANGPFIPVDCSAIADSLFESQLFGHTRGAFTGASQSTLGAIRAADGGTLFLDEIGELSLIQQAKLLRVLQERAVTPVGQTRPVPVDIRLVCATNRDLESMVKAGTFREDLYFRIHVLDIRVPTLRERADDIIPLAIHFLQRQAEIYDEPVKALSPEAALILKRHPWPGNIRELQNVMEHAHVLATSGLIHPEDLPPRLRRSAGSETDQGELSLDLLERRAIAEALRRTRNNKAAASRMLGINVQRLTRRMKRFKLD